MPERDERPVYGAGEWEVDLARRELRVRGETVPIGGRAFEIIEILVQSNGRLVTKDELMTRVWPGAIVEESALVVHVSAIRKALGPDRGMLQTASGRGYRLVGDWDIRRESVPTMPGARETARLPGRSYRTNIPAAGSELIGRATVVQHLRELLSAYRVVTLTGPGGIGKTAMAMEVARTLFQTFEGDSLVAELVSLSDPRLVPTTVAGVLELKLGSDGIAADSVARAIGQAKLLLVLDNCEHVIDAAATLADALVRLCPRASILVTSREILRIDGEYVYRVPPLEVPPQNEEKPEISLGHSAVQLFVARTTALRADFLPTNENLPAIIAVCRRLDGIPLAIEFAAARAATLGVREVAARLDDRFRLLTDGRRTALPRHQTLRATLDWSYELLPRLEQRLLRRLAIFPSGFTLEAASAIMADVAGTASTVVEGIAHLVEKSLVVLDGSASAPRWRLLETTRAYALEKLVENDEAGEVARNHAEYHRLLFEQAEAESTSRSKTGWLAAYGREIDDVRAPDEVRRSLVHCLDDVRSALDWAFGPGAAPEVGIALTVAALRLWQELLLMEECHRQVERALASSARMQNGDPHQEMMLFAALGNSTLHTTGDDSALDHAWGNALKRAEQIGDTHHQLRGLNGLALGAMRRSYREALVFARRYQRLAETSFDPQEAMAGDRLTGYVLHVLGEHTGARHLIEGMLTRYIRPTDRRHLAKRNFDERILAKSTLARILWLQGFPSQSIRLANEAVEEAHAVDHIPSLIFAVAYAACPIALLEGDLGLAAPGRDLLRTNLAGGSPWQHPWKQWGAGYSALDRIQQGEMAAGLEMLLGALAAMPRHAFSYRFGLFHAGLAETLLRCQRLDEALKAADAALAQCQILDEHWFEPELIRLRGEIWFARTHDESEAAEQFQAALDLARSQTALAWELRAATSLARLWRSKGRVRSASEVLAPIFSRFTEGFDTADLITARSLL